MSNPAWGYKDGEAKLFEDGKLPAGWSDAPGKKKAVTKKAKKKKAAR